MTRPSLRTQFPHVLEGLVKVLHKKLEQLPPIRACMFRMACFAVQSPTTLKDSSKPSEASTARVWCRLLPSGARWLPGDLDSKCPAALSSHSTHRSSTAAARRATDTI